MKIVTLVENTACREDLRAEHGLSLYIETGEHKILLDMGQSDAFSENAKRLGVDLSRVDFAVLSHGHYDHGGGLATFLQVNSHAPVYVHKAAFGEYYNGTEKYIGLPKHLKDHPRVILCDGSRELTSGITLTDCADENWMFSSWGLCRKDGDVFAPDDFVHEHYLLIREGEKRVVLSGCSHRGIENIAAHFRADALIGGFHLNKLTEEETLERIAQNLMSYGTTYYTGHCTGNAQFAQLGKTMSHRLQSISTGVEISI